MNKKLIKALSIFVIAGAIGTGTVVGLAGCSNKEPEHTHTAATEWKSDATKHWHDCTENDGAKLDEAAHDYTDDQDATCNTCGYERTITPAVVAVTGVTLDKSSATLKMGETESVTLVATVAPSNATNKNVTWSSDNTAVATVANGVVTAVSAGTATITVTTADGSKTASCAITVEAAAPEGYVIPNGVDQLLIEGIDEEVNLSTTYTSHTIDKTAIKVYLSAAGVKGEEVPAENFDLELYLGDSDEALTDWSGLKEDADYIVVAILKDAVKADGTEAVVEGELTVTVNNALVSLARKSGTVTQVQGANVMTADWTFEATRANGDKVDIAAADVEIGTMDTNTVGENKTVTISLKGNAAVTGSVTYSITADASLVAQAYAMNFGYLTAAQETALKDGEVVTLQDGRFEVQSATGGEVASHNKEYEGKYFVKRLKVNGASANKAGCSRYIKVKADGAGTITVVAYNNSGAVGDGASRGVELYTSRTADPAGDTYAGKIGETVAVPSKEHATGTFTITGAGEYYITCDAAMTFAYVQLDQLVSASTGSEVALGGETIVSTIDVTAPETVTNFKVGDTFTHAGYTVKATGVNNVTCVSGETDVTADAEFVAPDLTTIGKKTVTVNYGGVSATYEVIVETAVAGIYGATASLKAGVETQVTSANGKISLKNDDIEIALIGENAEATTTHVAKYNDTAIGTGTEFGVGTHTLTVEVTVTAGAASDTIVVELEILVDIEAVAGASEQFLSPDTLPAETAIAESATITENSLVKVVAGGEMEYFAGDAAKSSIAKGEVGITLADGTAKTMGSAIRTLKSSAAGAATSAITITAKSKISLRLYAVTCNDSYNSHKAGTLSYSVNAGTATDVATGANRKTPTVIEVTLEAGDVLTLTGAGTAEGVRLYLFGLEATAI